jgi:hypothetical protein
MGWGNFSKKLRQTAKNKDAAGRSRLKANAPNWEPANHVLRIPRNSNANFTRKENKKMANAVYRNLERVHKERMREQRGGTRKEWKNKLHTLRKQEVKNIWNRINAEPNRQPNKNAEQNKMTNELFHKLGQFHSHQKKLYTMRK